MGNVNRWKTTVCLFFVGVLFSCAAPPSIPGDIESFQRMAQCGAVVEIDSILGRQVGVTVLTHFGKRDCGIPDRLVVDLFEKEMINWARESRKAVLFPRPADDRWEEVVRGCSFWKIFGYEDNDLVEITSRNTFLLGEHRLEEGEVAYIPLHLVIDLFNPDQESERGEIDSCAVGCSLVERGCENVGCCPRSKK